MTLEYVTGAETINVFDAIIVHILNTGELTGSARLIVFENAGGGAAVFADTGDLTIAPTFAQGIGVSALTNGTYWLRIYLSSNELVPNASFIRQGGQFASYSPGDFAVFERIRR